MRDKGMKKHLLILVAILVVGAVTAALPPAKAQFVRFYISDGVDNIYAYGAVGTTRTIEVWVESPPEWADTPSGIVGYALSIRVDPTILEPLGAAKTASGGGLLETFLVDFGYDLEGYTTSFLVGPADKPTGTIFDASEYIGGYSTLGVGAGGGPTKLMRFTFRSKSDAVPSMLDICGRPIAGLLEANAIYTTPDGADHYVDIMDDGYYGAQITDEFGMDLTSTLDPVDPVGSTWVEKWPNDSDSRAYTINGWTDTNATGALNSGDKISVLNATSGGTDYLDVLWANIPPTSNDGRYDLVLKTGVPPVPEFPLGIELLIALAPMIAVVYLWRTRPKKRV
jgi:hypothetical protein